MSGPVGFSLLSLLGNPPLLMAPVICLFSHRIARAAQSDAAITAQSTFRTEFYYPLLDLLLSEMRRRFSTQSCELLVQLSAFNPTPWDEKNIEKVGKLTKRYSIPEGATCREYILLKGSRYLRDLVKEMEERKKKRWKNSYLHLILKMFGQSDLVSLYPNLHKLVCIAATIPVTIASCERCHSKVRIVNNYMGAAMDEDRLESLVLISSERDLVRHQVRFPC